MKIKPRFCPQCGSRQQHDKTFDDRGFCVPTGKGYAKLGCTEHIKRFSAKTGKRLEAARTPVAHVTAWKQD